MAKTPFHDRWLFFLNMLMALGLLCTYVAPYINPEKFWFAAVLGLAYPFLLLINAGFVAYWLLKKRVYIFLPVICILLGWSILKDSVGFNYEPLEKTEEDSLAIKIMTYNVKNFDLYNWNENIDSRNKMMNMFHEKKPDIICFQEFYTEDGGDFENIKFLTEKLGYKHHFFAKTLTLRGKDHWGVAIFSKYPLNNKQHVKFDKVRNNTVASADITVDGKTFRLFNAHLQSIHLGQDDLAYMEHLSKSIKEGGQKEGEKGKEFAEHLKLSSSILEKLKNAFVKRGKQAVALADSIKTSPYPVVVCGDFNDTPASFTYRTISKNLQDAFLKTGLGLGGTYDGPMPSFRIDYVLLDPDIIITDFQVVKRDYSDHYPVSCSFVIP